LQKEFVNITGSYFEKFYKLIEVTTSDSKPYFYIANSKFSTFATLYDMAFNSFISVNSTYSNFSNLLGAEIRSQHFQFEFRNCVISDIVPTQENNDFLVFSIYSSNPDPLLLFSQISFVNVHNSIIIAYSNQFNIIFQSCSFTKSSQIKIIYFDQIQFPYPSARFFNCSISDNENIFLLYYNFDPYSPRYVSSNSLFLIENCLFSNNKEITLHFAFYIPLVWINSSFLNNTNQLDDFFVIFSSLQSEIIDGNFASNQCDMCSLIRIYNIYSTHKSNGSVRIINTQFLDTKSLSVGSVVLMDSQTTLIIQNSEFSDCYSSAGGCIHTLSFCNLQISQSNFSNGFSYLSNGGIISLGEFSSLNLSYSYFKETIANFYGGSIFCDSHSNVSILSCAFSQFIRKQIFE
jgi:hypothetical protein